MASKKPRNKKYNWAKMYNLVGSYCLRDLVIAWTAGHEGIVLFNAKTGVRIHRTDKKIMEAIHDVKHKWYYSLTVFCRRQDGHEYAGIEEVAPPQECFMRSISASLTEHHKNLLQNCNALHVLNVGYIGTMFDAPINKVIMWKIYDQMKAFDYLSNWEKEQQQQPVERGTPDEHQPATEFGTVYQDSALTTADCQRFFAAEQQ